MLTLNFSGGRALGDVSNLNYTCGASTCDGRDVFTQAMFRALQAQINRFYVEAAKKSNNPAAMRARLVDVDGRIGDKTVQSYAFLVGGLAQGGAVAPVNERSASRESLAQQADNCARFLQAVGDRAGLPSAAASVPDVPSSNGGTSVGPATSLPSGVQIPNARDIVNSMSRGFGPGSVINPQPSLPDAPGLPADELVSQINTFPQGGSGGMSTNTKIALGVGGVLLLGLGIFAVKRRG